MNDNSSDRKFPNDRRVTPRISGILVEYYVDQDKTLKKAFVKDINMTGICIYAKGTFNIGAIIRIDIYLFGEETPISSMGSVIWQKPEMDLDFYNVGIQFTEMSRQHKKILSRIVALNKTN